MNLIETAREQYPELKKLIGPVFERVGSGWSLSSRQSGYGLTYPGIKKAAEILKLNITTCKKPEELVKAVNSCPENSIFSVITDSGNVRRLFEEIYFEEDDCFDDHAIAVIVQKIENKVRLFIFDSQSTHSDFVPSKVKNVLSDIEFEWISPSFTPQPVKDKTCYAYAIHTCKMISENPELLNEFPNSYPETLMLSPAKANDFALSLLQTVSEVCCNL